MSNASSSRHVVVTRFSVPLRAGAAGRARHADPEWLAGRLELLRRFYVPSVGRLGVPAMLLCSPESAARVADAVRDLGWVRVVEQDDWYGGWTGRPDQVLTRLDSDDALREGWFRAVDGAPAEAEAVCTRRFLRLDRRTGRVVRYRRGVPSPLAAFRGGRNPFAHDHDSLERSYSTAFLPGAYLLQVAHGGNLSTRFAKPFRRRASPGELEGFGLSLS